MKINILIPSLNIGGAEKIAVTLSNHLSSSGHSVHLILFSNSMSSIHYTLNKSIKLSYLDLIHRTPNIFNKIFSNLYRIKVIRDSVINTSPDLLISFLTETNILTILARVGLKIPVVVTEHSDPFKHPTNKYWRFIRNYIYPFSDRIIVLTEKAKLFFPKKLHSKISVIGNPIDNFHKSITNRPVSDVFNILSVGNMRPEKGHKTLILAYSNISALFKNTKLILIGGGPEQSKLESLCKELNLESRVKFTGLLPDWSSYLEHADLFVLASQYEGFPVALSEAMSWGVPSIATSTMGANELIKNNVNGLLVPIGNPSALAASMEELIRNKNKRERLAHEGKNISIQFSIQNFISKWDHLLSDLIN